MSNKKWWGNEPRCNKKKKKNRRSAHMDIINSYSGRKGANSYWLSFENSTEDSAPQETVKKSNVDEALQVQIEQSVISRSYGDLPADKKPLHIVVARNGVFEVRDNEVGTFTYCLATTNSGLEILGSSTFRPQPVVLKLPPIPIKLLKQTISFFKDVCKQKNNAEAWLQIFFDRQKQTYFIYVGDQTVSGSSVKFERNKSLEQEYLLVMDIHSHNTMEAFWSGTDNADEKETRLYGVIGKLNNETPTMKFRASVAGKFIALDVTDIFNGDPNKEEYPVEWMDKIKNYISAATDFVTRNVYGRGGGYFSRPGINSHEDYLAFNKQQAEKDATSDDNENTDEEDSDSGLDVSKIDWEKIEAITDNNHRKQIEGETQLRGEGHEEETEEEDDEDSDNPAMAVEDIADSIRDLKDHERKYLAELLENEGLMDELIDARRTI